MTREEINRVYTPPYDLDEAAEIFNREDAARMWDYEGKTNGEIVEAAFKAGAEWMAVKKVTDWVDGTVCGKVSGHINVRFIDVVGGEFLVPKNISHIPADVSKFNIGDKVTIQILKK